MTQWDKLKEPFPAKDVEWRIQQQGEINGKIWARVLAYITNRAIQERMDTVVGVENWKNEYQKAPDGGVMCGISIRIGDEWVTKWDGAENTDIEGVKGGLSNAMKRAGVQWGIGRYLYNLDADYATISPNGAHYAQTKTKTPFKWDPPALPAWALPIGETPPPKKTTFTNATPDNLATAGKLTVEKKITKEEKARIMTASGNDVLVYIKKLNDLKAKQSEPEAVFGTPEEQVRELFGGA